MRDQAEPKLSKWPFFLGDVLLLGVAVFISVQGRMLPGVWQAGFLIMCVAGGAGLGILPFVLEYRVLAKVAETEALGTIVSQIQNIETVAARISEATGQWQNIHGEAEKIAASAKGIAERMGAEVRAFSEFMQKINDGEKATLRLEVEKMQRGESDWLQVSIRMLDHVYALNLGAMRSGQPKLIAQLSNFQNACRDAARRVGLTPFAAEPAEPFDVKRHQLLEGEKAPSVGAIIAETLATGYTFQGRMLRPALVRLKENNADGGGEEEKQSSLPLGAEAAEKLGI
jgi:molecular chaperone GrpE (heat shock protein)